MKSIIVSMIVVIIGSSYSIADAQSKREVVHLLQNQREILPVEYALKALGSRLGIKTHSNRDRLTVDYTKRFGVPRLQMYGPFFYVQGRLKPMKQWTVDMSAPFFEAMTYAWIDLKAKQAPWGARLRREAQQIYTDIPSNKREEVYRVAIGEWVGHMLSVRHSIDRSYGRIGDKLCDLSGGPIFRLWENNFIDTHFFGAYWNGDDWVYTRNNLPETSRRWVADTVLEGRYIGDAKADLLTPYCEDK